MISPRWPVSPELAGFDGRAHGVTVPDGSLNWRAVFFFLPIS